MDIEVARASARETYRTAIRRGYLAGIQSAVEREVDAAINDLGVTTVDTHTVYLKAYEAAYQAVLRAAREDTYEMAYMVVQKADMEQTRKSAAATA